MGRLGLALISILKANFVAYLAKKIEQAHVVWFQASNQWVQFDEQQWLIFCFYNDGLSQEEAVKKLCKKYSFQVQAAQAFVENIYFSLENLFNPSFQLPDFSQNTQNALAYQIPKKKTHAYSFRSKAFSITYGSPYLEQYIHLPLAHLEKDSKVVGLSIDVFPFENRYAIRVNGENKKCLSADEPGQIKRLLYIELSNFFYDKNHNEWIAFLHGSAVTRNDKVLVLTSEGGSGKSTMAAMLQLHGFEFFSDDFIPVATTTGKVFPFPAALCLKNNAIELIESQGLKLNRNSNGSSAYVKYSPKDMQTQSCRMNKVVFIKYNPKVDLEFNSVSVLEALYYFLQEAWVGDDMKRARKFISWFSKLQFYSLEYGNTTKAIEILTKLTEKE